VLDKLAEGRKRWEEMARLERSGQTEEFVHSLSAFLECFRATANRLYGVVETESGYQTMKAVESQLNSHPQIGYLIDRAISESQRRRACDLETLQYLRFRDHAKIPVSIKFEIR
jgi:hypothetical protein